MSPQPNYMEPLLHFDLYSITMVDNEVHVVQMFKNLSWLAAELVAGVTNADFCQSIEYTGWLGTCPEWHKFQPIVAVPRGEQLDLDHIDFILECI